MNSLEVVFWNKSDFVVAARLKSEFCCCRPRLKSDSHQQNKTKSHNNNPKIQGYLKILLCMHCCMFFFVVAKYIFLLVSRIDCISVFAVCVVDSVTWIRAFDWSERRLVHLHCPKSKSKRYPKTLPTINFTSFDNSSSSQGLHKQIWIYMYTHMH